MPLRNAMRGAALGLLFAILNMGQPFDLLLAQEEGGAARSPEVHDAPAQGTQTEPPPWQLGWVIPYPDLSIGFQGWMTNLRAARDGSIWMVDNWAQHIYQFDAEGVFQSVIAAPGCREGQLGGISSMLVDEDRIYVLRAAGCPPTFGSVGINGIFTAKGSVSLFSRDGLYLGPWKPEDWPDQAKLVAIDRKGQVYVIAYHDKQGELEGSYVYQYSREGKLLHRWGGKGLEPGQFGGVIAVDVAEDGTIYVGDTGNARVLRFAEDGTPLGGWGRHGLADGEFHELAGLAVGPSGDVYVLESAQSRRGSGLVSRFSADGSFIQSFAGAGRDGGGFGDGLELALGQDGSVIVQMIAGRITRSSADGLPRPWQGLTRASDDNAYFRWGTVAISDDEEVFFMSYDDHILRYELDGARLPDLELSHLLDPIADSDDLFVELRRSADNQLVLRSLLGELVWLDTEGTEIKRWKLEFGQADWRPFDLTPSGEVYVGALAGESIRHYDASGALTAEWQLGDGVSEVEFSKVRSLAATADGNVWVVGYDCTQSAELGECGPEGAEETPIRFTRYSPTGEILSTWHWSEAEGETSLLPIQYSQYLYGDALELKVSSRGELLLASWLGIFVFTPEGRLIQWLPGSSFSSLATDSKDRILALCSADSSPNLFQVFERGASGPWQASYFRDQSFTGWPSAALRLTDLRLDWGASAPAEGMPAQGWAARFRRLGRTETGLHRFAVAAEGGLRMWIDDRLQVNAFGASRVDTSFEIVLSGQPHDILLEFADNADAASLRLDREFIGADMRLYLPALGPAGQ